MKFIFTILTALFFSTSFSAAADPSQGNDPKMQEMMAKYKEYATPGAAHKVLAEIEGNWTYTTKAWHTANGKPEESVGTAKMAMILGGRWLQSDLKGTMMGQPFNGIVLTGYDNVKKKYESIMIDDMGTGSMHSSGAFDTGAKTLRETGNFSCPIAKDKNRKYRSDWKLTDKNNMIYTFYAPGLDGGKEFKQIEVIYKRVK